MLDKDEINRKRDFGGSAEIGSEEDGAIIDSYNLNEKLIIIKERALYEFMLADYVDPQRTNISIPHSIQRLIINQGSESEMVCRTFLTAKNLFKPQFFDSLDTFKALNLTLGLLTELSVLEGEINEYLLKEKLESEEYQNRRSKPVSYALPSIGDVEIRCKRIFQSAYHLEQIIIEVATLFYPDEKLSKQSHFPKLYSIIKAKYGDQDPFTLFIEKSLGFMKIVMELRNSLEHRLGFAKVKDFEIKLDSNILSPTIELDFKDIKLERQALSAFLPIVLQNMITIFEITIAHLSAKNVKSDFMSYSVREIPEEKRRFKYVKYGFHSGALNFFHQ